jgi:hypothetical protein
MEALEAERFMQTVLNEGRSWLYPEVAPETVLSAIDGIKHSLANRFEEVCIRHQQENQTLLQIKLTQLTNHFARRRQADERRLETLRKRAARESLIAATEARIRKDQENEDRRKRELQGKAQTREEFAVVACGIVKVTQGS